MSVDFDVVCASCRRRMHLGRMAGFGWVFSYASGDTEGQQRVGNWIYEHSEHGVSIQPSEAAIEFEVETDEFASRRRYDDEIKADDILRRFEALRGLSAGADED